MKEIDIIQQIKLGEVSKVQFKERLLDNYDIGCDWWLSVMHVVARWLLVR